MFKKKQEIVIKFRNGTGQIKNGKLEWKITRPAGN